MMRFLEGTGIGHLPFAPPFLKAGDRVIAQTANILLYLGPRLGLVPKAEAGRLWAHQLQLTIGVEDGSSTAKNGRRSAWGASCLISIVISPLLIVGRHNAIRSR